MAKKKKKVIKIHPEVMSAISTFLAGAIPPFIAQVHTVDIGSLEVSAIMGLLLVAFRIGVKYGLVALVKWIVEKLSNYKIN